MNTEPLRETHSDDHRVHGQGDIASESSPDRWLQSGLTALRENGPFAYTLAIGRFVVAKSDADQEQPWVDRVGESLTTGELRGVLDLQSQRSVGFRDGFSLVEVDDTAWAGRPGKKIASVAAAPSSWRVAPLAVIRALHAPLAVEEDGSVNVNGHPVRVLRVQLDGAIATVALGGPVHRVIIESEDRFSSLELESTLIDAAEFGQDRLPKSPLR